MCVRFLRRVPQSSPSHPLPPPTSFSCLRQPSPGTRAFAPTCQTHENGTRGGGLANLLSFRSWKRHPCSTSNEREVRASEAKKVKAHGGFFFEGLHYVLYFCRLFRRFVHLNGGTGGL